MIHPLFATVKVKKLFENAQLPTRAHELDAGNDLRSAVDKLVAPGAIVQIPTGLAMSLPSHTDGTLKDRSSMALKGFHVLGGVMDSPYRGEYSVILINLGRESLWIEAGQKVAQLVIRPIVEATFEEVDELDNTDRGTKGFGSSGL